MHPIALVERGLSVSFACFCLKCVMSQVAAATVWQHYVILKQKTRVTPTTVRDGHRTPELS